MTPTTTFLEEFAELQRTRAALERYQALPSIVRKANAYRRLLLDGDVDTLKIRQLRELVDFMDGFYEDDYHMSMIVATARRAEHVLMGVPVHSSRTYTFPHLNGTRHFHAFNRKIPWLLDHRWQTVEYTGRNRLSILYGILFRLVRDRKISVSDGHFNALSVTYGPQVEDAYDEFTFLERTEKIEGFSRQCRLLYFELSLKRDGGGAITNIKLQCIEDY